MPLIKLQTSVAVPEPRREPLLTAASRLLSEATGKPETYVMAVLEPATATCMGGAMTPAVFVDVRGIGGWNAKVNATVTQGLCALLAKELNIPGDGVYVTFTDVPAVNWGWNGRTFG